MALFAVNRYGEYIDDENGKLERRKLEKLQKKIEKRKKDKVKILNETAHLKTDCDETDLEHNQIIDVTDSFKQLSEDASVELKHEKDSENERSKNINVHQFQILGITEFEKKEKIKRILPYWLSHPTPISLDLKEHNHEVEHNSYLHNSLKKKLSVENIKYLFPVQARVIPWLLEEHRKSNFFWPRDLCVSAPTGSGKTLAYVLPIIQLLSGRLDRQIRALVVLPVKELASQVAKVFKDYCVGTNLKVALISGLIPYIQEKMLLLKHCEMFGWQSEVDIVVCTAGRLVEHLQRTEGFTLQHLQFLVVDEADRIMQHIQNDWLHHLNQHLDNDKSVMCGKTLHINFETISTLRRPPQKLFFSATLTHDPEKLNEWGLFQPKLFSVISKSTTETSLKNSQDSICKYTTPLELIEKYTLCELKNKPVILYNLLNDGYERVLCFTNSAQTVHRLSILLRYMMSDKIKIAELSSALNQKVRDRILKKFHNGNINILISTDALARGIDVVNCDSVISYDPPKNVKTYVHRVGRTGRAGRTGTAIAILTHNQLKPFQDILSTANKLAVEQIVYSDERIDESLKIYDNAMSLCKHKIVGESRERITKLTAVKRGRSVIATKLNKNNR